MADEVLSTKHTTLSFFAYLTTLVKDGTGSL